MSRIAKLHPYPDGWYVVANSDELQPKKVLTVKFMGEEVVLFRTEQGKLNTIEAHCPHLGGHFGHGGKVDGESIRCPFHGFCFDDSGKCISTPYGFRAPPAKARTWHSDEKNGFIFLYHSQEDSEPDWQIPEIDFTDWNPLQKAKFKIKSHPQETSENSVDLGHFTEVHGYSSVEVLREATTSGSYLNATYAFSRPGTEFMMPNKMIRSEFTVHVHGLGFSYVEVSIKQLGLNFKTFVMPTPIDEDYIHLNLALSLKSIEKLSKVHPALALLPKQLAHMIISKFSFKAYLHDVQQDFKIWENKAYIAPPALARGDGPVGVYRKWTKQFYPS